MKRSPSVCARRALALTALLMSAGCAGGERAQRASELAVLKSQVEELRRAQETNAKELARLSGEVKAVDAQAAFLVGEAKRTGDELGLVRTALEENRQAVAALRAPAGSATRSDAGAAPVANATPAELYALALAHVQAEEWDASLSELTAITKRFPEHPLAANAQYWIGEVYYRRGDLARALTEFQRAVDGYPKSAQIPESLLKIGACHRGLKDPARARDVWQQLVKQFPGTNAAEQARAMLATPDPGGQPGKTGAR